MEQWPARLGANIRAARLEAGLTQEELALEAQTSHSHIGRIERGLGAPTVRTVVKLHRALHVPFEQLVEGIAGDDS